MALPVTGPYRQILQPKNGMPNRFGFVPSWLYIDRSWYRQQKPYDRPLNYSYVRKELTLHSSPLYYNTEVNNQDLFYLSSYEKAVYNKAWERFQDEIRTEKSSILVNLAQFQQAADGFSSMAKRLALGLRAAKRGNLKELRRHWGKDSGIKRRAKRAGGHVLEYSFGWAPLVSDLNSALSVMVNGMPPLMVRGVAQKEETNGKSHDYGAFTGHFSSTTLYRVKLGATLEITNPNAFLAESLGLVNLGEVLWEVIPWSFVFDYFFNVSTLIQSWNSDFGFTLKNPWRVTVTSVVGLRNCPSWDPGVTNPGYPPPTYAYNLRYISRIAGPIPGPQLTVRLPWKMSVQRGATSIALLLQQLR